MICLVCGTTLELTDSAPQAEQLRDQIRGLDRPGPDQGARSRTSWSPSTARTCWPTPDTEGFDLTAWVLPGLAIVLGGCRDRGRARAEPRPPRPRRRRAGAERRGPRAARRRHRVATTAERPYIDSGALIPSTLERPRDRSLRQHAERGFAPPRPPRPRRRRPGSRGRRRGSRRPWPSRRRRAGAARGARRPRRPRRAARARRRDQGALGRLERTARAGRPAIAASTASSPALRRMLAIRACAYWT